MEIFNIKPIANNNSMTFTMSQGNISFGRLFLCAAIISGMVTAIETAQPIIPTIEK